MISGKKRNPKLSVATEERYQRGTQSWSRSYRLFFRTLYSSEISLRNPLRARETPRRRHEPCHVFRMNLHDVPPCTYVTFYRVYVHAYACADRPACGQRFPAAADVGPSSRGPPRDTKLGMIIPYLPTEGRDVPSCRILHSTQLDPI